MLLRQGIMPVAVFDLLKISFVFKVPTISGNSFKYYGWLYLYDIYPNIKSIDYVTLLFSIYDNLNIAMDKHVIFDFVCQNRQKSDFELWLSLILNYSLLFFT